MMGKMQKILHLKNNSCVWKKKNNFIGNTFKIYSDPGFLLSQLLSDPRHSPTYPDSHSFSLSWFLVIFHSLLRNLREVM